MESVLFITCEDEETNQILSFALDHGEGEIRSLILLRTPIYERFLDETERGVSVSMEFDTDDYLERNLLEVVKIESNKVTIQSAEAIYDLDIGRLDPEDLSEMISFLVRMNFDGRFSIERR